MRPEFVDEKACLESLARSSVDLNRVVLLPQQYENRNSQSLPASANILRTIWSTQAVKIEYAAREKSWLVIAQTYHPNWKAYIEGRQIPVVRANHAFQAVEVPGGHHEIILCYRDKGFGIGVIISILSLVIVALSFFQTASNLELRKQTGSEST
jgi:uncharacterized membrane protein YfhO